MRKSSLKYLSGKNPLVTSARTRCKYLQDYRELRVVPYDRKYWPEGPAAPYLEAIKTKNTPHPHN